MGREDGFVVADVASGYFDDEKIRRLWRLLAPDVSAMCEATTIHQATVLASWREGRRVSVDEAAPLWLPIREDLVARLLEVGLLDRHRKVPPRSWTSWNGPAVARRDARREAGRRGGEAKAKRSSSGATAELYPTVPTGRQAGPSAPSDPSSAPARARGGRASGAGPTSLGAALEGTPLGEEIARRRSG